MGLSLQDEPTSPPKVLLIEDELLISLDLCDTLVQAGYDVLGPATTVAGAMLLLRQHRPDLAIVDVLLRDGPCTEVARRLRQSQVPFLIHSGYGRHSVEIDGFADAPWLAKPAQPCEIVTLVRGMSDRATSEMAGT